MWARQLLSAVAVAEREQWSVIGMERNVSLTATPCSPPPSCQSRTSHLKGASPPTPHSDTTHIMCVMFSSRAGEALDARPAIDLLSVVPNTLPPAILPKIGVSASQYPINHDLPLIQYEFASLKSTKTAVK